MKSFRESLTITKNYKLLEQFIIELDSLGVNPNRFFDWYLSEGISLCSSNLLSEGFNEWVLKEGVFSGLLDRWTQGRSEKEKQNLDKEFPGYERTGERLGSYAQKSGEFLGNQVARARGRYNSLVRGITGGETGSTTSPQTPSPSSSAAQALEELSKRYQLSRELRSMVGDENFGKQIMNLFKRVKSLKEHFSIEKKLFILSNSGLDVESLVEWYSEERLNIQEGIGNWFQKAGNWLGGQWQNLKHAWNSWGEGDKERNVQKNKIAVKNALEALSRLKQQSGTSLDDDFSKLLDVVLQKLNYIQSKSQSQSQSQFQSDVYGDGRPMPDGAASVFVGNLNSDEKIGHKSGWLGNSETGQQDYVGKTQMYKGPQPRPGIKKPINPGTGAIDVGAGIQNSSTNYDSADNKKFLESLMPKENKFSWFGY